MLITGHQGFFTREALAGIAETTLRNLTALWKRPVRLETVIDGKLRLLGHDGPDERKKPEGFPGHL